jgi:hypothetical protein
MYRGRSGKYHRESVTPFARWQPPIFERADPKAFAACEPESRMIKALSFGQWPHMPQRSILKLASARRLARKGHTESNPHALFRGLSRTLAWLRPRGEVKNGRVSFKVRQNRPPHASVSRRRGQLDLGSVCAAEIDSLGGFGEIRWPRFADFDELLRVAVCEREP